MMRFIRRALILLVLAVACTAGGPRDPVWGKQTCKHCGMLVSEARYAGQLLTTQNERLYFDDIGCLVEYVDRERGAASKLWVYAEGGWVEAESARYGVGAPSPMDYGFVPDPSATLDFSGVRRAVASRREQMKP